MKNLSFAIILLLLSGSVMAQSPFDGYQHLFTPPKAYTVGYTNVTPAIDGKIDEKVWENAAWTTYFGDIEGDLKPKPYHPTRVKMLWDEEFLYFAAHLEEPHLWGTLTKRDEIVYYDNDFEIFLDPGNSTHNYFEIEINTLNTIFDLFITKPYRNNCKVFFDWNTPGMLHAVDMQGTLNDAGDKDVAWTIEFAIPFGALAFLETKTRVPEDGDMWRLNFSRVQWEMDVIDGKYVKQKGTDGKSLPENNWVWSPQGVIDMHRPERWGYLLFSKQESSHEVVDYRQPYSERQRNYLWLAYYKQKEFYQEHKRYAKTLKELGLDNLNIEIDGKINTLAVEASDALFGITISDSEGKSVRINDEGYVK